MEYLRSFLTRYFAGKSLVALRNVGSFLKQQNRRSTWFVLEDLQHYLTQITCAQNEQKGCLQEVQWQKIIEDVKERYCNYLNGQHIWFQCLSIKSNVTGTLSIICQTIKSGLSICDLLGCWHLVGKQLKLVMDWTLTNRNGQYNEKSWTRTCIISRFVTSGIAVLRGRKLQFLDKHRIVLNYFDSKRR